MCSFVYVHCIVVHELVKTLGDQMKILNNIYFGNTYEKGGFKAK